MIVSIGSCKNHSVENRVTKISNDTTEIIRLLLDSTFADSNLPDFQYQIDHSLMGDTLFINCEIPQITNILESYFPSKNEYVLSVVDTDEICQMHKTRLDTDKELRNFLEIFLFEKKNEDYLAGIQYTCVGMRYEEGIFEHLKAGQLDSISCSFGMMCGCGFLMKVEKHGKSLEPSITMKWFD